MLTREQPGRIHVAFDDHRLVANSGLILTIQDKPAAVQNDHPHQGRTATVAGYPDERRSKQGRTNAPRRRPSRNQSNTIHSTGVPCYNALGHRLPYC